MVDVARLPPILSSTPSSLFTSPKGMARRISAKQAGKAKEPPHPQSSSEWPEEVLELVNKDPIRWIEYKGAMEDDLGARYTPINEDKEREGKVNGVTKTHTFDYAESSTPPPAKRQKVASTAITAASHDHDLYKGPIDLRWPSKDGRADRASGLMNAGNTCFLNSVLQVWMHTPALVNHLADHHNERRCKLRKEFGECCLAGYLNDMAKEVWSRRKAFFPRGITGNIKKIGSLFRPGRQEDAHEFLRYGVDRLQKDELNLLGKSKEPHDIKETTWIHKIWGGRLRSRVTCSECRSNSDTFDTFLDLSLDLGQANSVEECLNIFTKQEHLRGKNKYKCEKCKKLVDATKQFIIAKAPPVLTIHLKRFKPLGGKINRPIEYKSTLNLNKHALGSGLEYELFGVTSHQGSGPHFGHYYSTVKGRDGQWYEMNDDEVFKKNRAPVSMSSAYLLHYVLRPGASLDAIIGGEGVKSKATPKQHANGTSNGYHSSPLAREPSQTSTSAQSPRPANGLVANGRSSPGPLKRKRDIADEDDIGEAVRPPLAPRASSTPTNKQERRFEAMKPNNFYGNSSSALPRQDSMNGEDDDVPAKKEWKGSWSPSKSAKKTSLNNMQYGSPLGSPKGKKSKHGGKRHKANGSPYMAGHPVKPKGGHHKLRRKF